MNEDFLLPDHLVPQSDTMHDELDQVLADIKPSSLPDDLGEDGGNPAEVLAPLRREVYQQQADRGLNTPAPWDPKLVFDLAVEVDDLPTILERYALSEDEFSGLMSVPAFRRELALMVRDVREDGVSFRSKAKLQAEDYLQILDEMVYDPTTPASVRLDAIKSAVKWGDLEPREKKNAEGNGGAQVNISIKF